MKYRYRLVSLAAALLLGGPVPALADQVSAQLRNFSLSYRDLDPQDAWTPYRMPLSSTPTGLPGPTKQQAYLFEYSLGEPPPGEPEFPVRFRGDGRPPPRTGAFIDVRRDGPPGSPLGLALDIRPPPGLSLPRQYGIRLEQGSAEFESGMLPVAPRSSITLAADSFLAIALADGNSAWVRSYFEVRKGAADDTDYGWIPEGEPPGLEGAEADYDVFGELGAYSLITESILNGEGEQAGSLRFTYTNDSDQWALIQARAGLDVSGRVLTPIPEPQTWALMLAGLGGLAALRRRAVRPA